MALWFKIVCLAGFAFQIGACPCGCLHENYWYLVSQSIVRCLSGSSHTTADQSTPDDNAHGDIHAHDHACGHQHPSDGSRPAETESDPSDEHEHCLCHDFVYLAGTTGMLALQGPTGAVAVLQHPNLLAGLNKAWIDLSPMGPAVAFAAPVRAELGVYRF